MKLLTEIAQSVKENVPLMTLYYNRRTGTITELCTGANNMNWFGDEQEDYSLIFDYIVPDYDQYVFNNHNQFRVVDGAIVLNEAAAINKYV